MVRKSLRQGSRPAVPRHRVDESEREPVRGVALERGRLPDFPSQVVGDDSRPASGLARSERGACPYPNVVLGRPYLVAPAAERPSPTVTQAACKSPSLLNMATYHLVENPAQTVTSLDSLKE